MAKKVVLINPGLNNFWASPHPPLNLGYIAGYLEANGIETHIIDELAGQDVGREIIKLKPDIVGITATTPLVPDAYRIARITRNMGIFTVMGGKHAMVMTEEALRNVDIVVTGEGEKAMLDIVNGERAKIVNTPYFSNLDELPDPAWHLMDMEFYLTCQKRTPSNHLRLFPRKSRIAALITTRGCPYSCIFCYNSWQDTPLRFHSAGRIFSTMKHLVEKYSADTFFFMDDDIIFSKDRFRKLCRLIIENRLNIIWGCQASVNSIDKEILQLAKEAGCYQIGFGFESGSQKILSILKKDKTTIESNARAVKLCKEVGIRSWATFMIGNPTETIEDIKKTFYFIKDNHIDGVGIHVTTPFPGTELWDWCEERNLIPEKLDWSIFNTTQVSIPACDTIPQEVIQGIRDRMQYYFHPLKLSDVLSKKKVLMEAILHPFMAIKKLKYLSIFIDRSKKDLDIEFIK